MTFYKKNLKKLENLPRELFEGLYCDNNKLTSLKGSPKVVTSYFACYQNKLTSILYSPKEMHMLIYSGNYLLSLDYVPSNHRL